MKTLEKVAVLVLASNEKFVDQSLLDLTVQLSFLNGINFVNVTFKDIDFTGSFFMKPFLTIANLTIQHLENLKFGIVLLEAAK